MARLFSKSVVEKEAATIQTKDIIRHVELIELWHEDYLSGTLRFDKELSREQAYNSQFFINILGYKEKPAFPHTFEPKATTIIGQQPDAIIGYFSSATTTDQVTAVVELKGAMINLDSPQRRAGNMSPVQQAFKYKAMYRNCPFVIVSNLWEFRLYHDNLLDFEKWTLADLIDPADDYLKFKTWYILLNSANFITSKGESKTVRLLDKTQKEQATISNEFYTHYRSLRLNLINNIIANNEISPTHAIAKAQLLLDRLVFVAFAEDVGLLPENILTQIVSAVDSSPFGGSLWLRLKEFFTAVDVGNTQLDIPQGYNGGLFKEDSILNNLNISEDVIRSALEIGNYDFAVDLRANVLGHIFEQSITDLEQLKANIDNSGKVVEPKRKKDGIYYTPEYIVRYIIDNTLGVFLRDKEDALKKKYGLKEDIKSTTYRRREEQAYKEYQSILQNIKIVDPACGNGAFLVGIYDFLISENKRVEKILGGSIAGLTSQVNTILQNNIYGVDINEESVEITKLSLWLKTAHKGQKLTTLDKNIKCGNSLVSNPGIAGRLAFDWNHEFAEVMSEGGFSFVLGNPPYGADIPKAVRDYLVQNYIQGAGETATAFLALGHKLLKPGGMLGYIIPKAFTYSNGYKAIRNTLMRELNEVCDCKKVWKEVKLEQVIVTLTKNQFTPAYSATKLANKKFVPVSLVPKAQSAKFGIILNDATEIEIAIANKMAAHKARVSDIATNTRGAAFQSAVEDSGRTPVLGGADIQRNGIRTQKGYLSIIPEGIGDNAKLKENSVLVQNIVAHIENPVDHIMIVAALPTNTHALILDTVNQLTCKASFSAKALMMYLNSDIINWYSYIFIFGRAIRTMHFDNPSSSQIPVPDNFIDYQDSLAKLADQKTAALDELYKTTTNVSKLIEAETGTPFTVKDWWKEDPTKILKKLKVSLIKKAELLELLNHYNPTLQHLSQIASNCELSANQLISEMFNLSDEEAELFANSNI
jgi:hypothetical protein